MFLEKKTTLHFAAQEGHFDVCKYFIDDLEGDKNPTNHDERTPLHTPTK